MPPPEPAPATTTIPLTRQEKEKLLQQMYSLPHWIEIVRLFGYQVMPMEHARQGIKPIAEKFGKEPVANACEALVEISNHAKEPFAQLKPHVRRMAFQILGPEPSSNDAGAPPPVVPKPARQPTTKKRHAEDASPAPDGRSVRQPRHFVLKQFEAWMNAAGLAFVAMQDVPRTTPAVAPFVSALDFIVLRGEEKLLVTVRPHLQAKHVSAIRELQNLFGAAYRPTRFWPTEGAEGWVWQEHLIEPAAKP